MVPLRRRGVGVGLRSADEQRTELEGVAGDDEGLLDGERVARLG